MSKELFEAIEKHDVELLARLLREGANPNELKAGWPEWLPLQAAVDDLAEGGPVEALTLLLRHGARVDEMGPALWRHSDHWRGRGPKWDVSARASSQSFGPLHARAAASGRGRPGGI